jgi:hypothetical protein
VFGSATALFTSPKCTGNEAAGIGRKELKIKHLLEV